MKKIIVIIGALLAAGAVIATWLYFKKTDPADTSAAAQKTAAAPAISVATAPVTQADLPVYVDALGSVKSLNTVTVSSRVDGQLQKIYFAEGQFVKAGDPLADIDPRPFEVQLLQAQGQLAKDNASLENARADLTRYESAREAVTRQQIDTARASVVQLEGSVKTDEAQIANAELQLTYAKITSPISGIVGLRLVDEGNLVRANDTGGIVVITQLQPISVVFTVPEVRLPEVFRAGAGGAKPDVEAYDREFKKKLADGKLAAFDNQIDASTGTLKIKAQFENKDNALFPNQFVNARLMLGKITGAVLAPAGAVQRNTNDKTYVFVVGKDNVAEMRSVVAGITEGDTTVIEKGLSAGEIVVTDGVDKLKNGSRVIVRNSAEKPGDAS